MHQAAASEAKRDCSKRMQLPKPTIRQHQQYDPPNAPMRDGAVSDPQAPLARPPCHLHPVGSRTAGYGGDKTQQHPQMKWTARATARNNGCGDNTGREAGGVMCFVRCHRKCAALRAPPEYEYEGPLYSQMPAQKDSAARAVQARRERLTHIRQAAIAAKRKTQTQTQRPPLKSRSARYRSAFPVPADRPASWPVASP
jgi:hypothetical protein